MERDERSAVGQRYRIIELALPTRSASGARLPTAELGNLMCRVSFAARLIEAQPEAPSGKQL